MRGWPRKKPERRDEALFIEQAARTAHGFMQALHKGHTGPFNEERILDDPEFIRLTAELHHCRNEHVLKHHPDLVCDPTDCPIPEEDRLTEFMKIEICRCGRGEVMLGITADGNAVSLKCQACVNEERDGQPERPEVVQ